MSGQLKNKYRYKIYIGRFTPCFNKKLKISPESEIFGMKVLIVFVGHNTDYHGHTFAR
jgi:hypothetical protein